VAYCDPYCNVIAPFVSAPHNRGESPLLHEALTSADDQEESGEERKLPKSADATKARSSDRSMFILLVGGCSGVLVHGPYHTAANVLNRIARKGAMGGAALLTSRYLCCQHLSKVGTGCRGFGRRGD
jgi:hypothetical protein